MHRVNPKKRRAAILRFIAYGVTLTLTTLTTVLLLFIALGYRLDSSNGHVTRNGLLLVDTKPIAAEIYVDNQLRDNSAPGRFVLAAGNYDLSLRSSGYREWNKNVLVSPSGVREVRYPLMIPTELRTSVLATVSDPTLTSQSQNRKRLLTHSRDETILRLFELNAKDFNQTTLPLGAAFTKENGSVGRFQVVEWALNNKEVLLKHTLPSGSIEFISLDVTEPDSAVNITKLYTEEQLSDIHYVGSNTDEIYGVSNGTLKRYSLEAPEKVTILRNIINYQPYSDDTILFTRVMSNQNHEVGIRKDRTTTIIQKDVAVTEQPILKYAKYDDHFYFVVAYSGGKVVSIYRDPLKKPILAKQLPYATLAFENTTNVTFSSSSQFVMVQNGNSFQTFDFEDVKQYSVTLDFDIAGQFTWIDTHHIQVVDVNNKSHMLDYDGENQQELVDTTDGRRLYFADNYEFAFRLMESEARHRIEAINFVSEP